MARPATLSRRAVLQVGAGAGLAWLVSPVRSAALTGSNLRFVFVFARGGWDTTRVFSPMGSAPLVETEPEAAAVERGDLVFVDHPDRPSVRAFFDTFGDRAAVVDGLLVRSVNHMICERLVQTGSARPDRPDWPSILGSVAAGDHALPTLVLSGPSNPGPLQRTTSLVGKYGQLQGLLDQSAFSRGEREVHAPEPGLDRRVDELVERITRRRRDALTDPGWRRIADAQLDGVARLARLRADAARVEFEATTFRSQAEVAVDMLAADVARCLCISLVGFDTHSDTAGQSPMFEEMFDGLGRLMALLDGKPGHTTSTLAEETVVVVQSEMGRTPYLNASGGKDHWPYTAAMLLGPGIRGGVRFGGYDERLSGLPMSLTTGETGAAGTMVTSEHLGATLLTLAGLDPRAWVDADPLEALLR